MITKKKLCIATVCLTLALPVFSQSERAAQVARDAPGPSSPFAMATVPALAIISSTQEILRPQSVAEVSAALGQFFDPSSTSLSIPANFGIEFAPGLVFVGDKLQIDDYIANQVLYRTLVSLATSKTSTNGRIIGIGVRVLAMDDSDYRTKTDTIVRKVEDLTTQINKVYEDATSSGPTDINKVKLTPEQQQHVDAIKQQVTDIVDPNQWTGKKLQFAAALSTSVPDASDAHGAKANSFAFWTDYTLQLIPNMTAVVFEGTYERTFPNDDSVSAAASVSIGSNQVKMNVDGRASYDVEAAQTSVAGTAGFQFRVPATLLWAHASGSLNYNVDTQKWEFTTGFTVSADVGQGPAKAP